MSLERPGSRKGAILPEVPVALSIYATPAISVHENIPGALCPRHQLTRDPLDSALQLQLPWSFSVALHWGIVSRWASLSSIT